MVGARVKAGDGSFTKCFSKTGLRFSRAREKARRKRQMLHKQTKDTYKRKEKDYVA